MYGGILMADLNEKINEFTNTENTTSQFDSSDINNNKIMAILAYISWLVLIPLLFAKDSKFARFHVNQGLVLAISEILVGLILGVLDGIPLIGWIFSIAGSLLGIVCFIFSILGIINALNGQAKELPIIGKFRILQ